MSAEGQPHGEGAREGRQPERHCSNCGERQRDIDHRASGNSVPRGRRAPPPHLYPLRPDSFQNFQRECALLPRGKESDAERLEGVRVFSREARSSRFAAPRIRHAGLRPCERTRKADTRPYMYI